MSGIRAHNAVDATPIGIDTTEHELRCMIEDRCSPAAVGLYALARLEAHVGAIAQARQTLLDATLAAPSWSPLADPAVRSEVDSYLRSASRASEVERAGPALDWHQHETEVFAQRMELVLQQYGSPKTASVLRNAVVASASNIMLATLVQRYIHAGCNLPLPNLAPEDPRLVGAEAAAIGEGLYNAYGRSLTLGDRLAQWRRPKSLPSIRATSLPSCAGDAGEWARQLSEQIERVERQAPDFGALIELETALPQKAAVRDRGSVCARVDAFREFEAQLPAVERAERSYILDVTAPEGSLTIFPRPPLVNIAQLVTYRRIRNHGDPLSIIKSNLEAVGVSGAMQIARAGEIALTRRYDELRYDRLQGADGDVFRRPAGSDVHPRYRMLAQRAVEIDAAPEFLEEVLPAFRDGERDPEYLRIDRYVSRLVEAELIRAAIGIIRPLTRGELIGSPKWPGRIAPVADLLFEEQEGFRPLLNASGEMVDWQDLVRRHPDARRAETGPRDMEPLDAEQTWIQPAVEDREAYASPAQIA
jgi:hypothetical protein